MSLFLDEVAKSALPLINGLAHKKRATTFAEKKEVSKWINSQAAQLGLAVRCPKTGKPGFFVGNGSDDREKGRFQLVLCEDASQRTVTSVQLPDFELVPRTDGVSLGNSWRGRCEQKSGTPGRDR